MNKNILEINNLSKQYVLHTTPLSNSIVHAVNNVSFTIQTGKSLGIIGESGSGKSTLANTILKLLPISSGQIIFNEQDITNFSYNDMLPIRKDLQIIFQYTQNPLDDKLTVSELLSEPLVIHQVVSTKDIESEITKLLSLVGLSASTKDKFPTELSGGQQQRVIIARAIALRPKLIICDEPVSALDVSVQGQILNLLKQLKKEFNLTYLFITHNLQIIQHICDHVAVMKNGQIIEYNEVEKIINSPKHPYTKELLSSKLHNK